MTSAQDEEAAGPTRRLARRLIDARAAPPPAAALAVAKQCLLDWLGVTLAGAREPLAAMLAEELAADAAPGPCTLIGLDRRARLLDAALINGAAGHALDFDDVITAMGHPTAPVAPAVLALAEARGAGGAELLAAFIDGVEAECRIGVLMGPSHYAKGWHGTGTFGTFGAAAAAARLLDLDEARLLHALGLAGTQAAGLKSVFGTMAKPLHAGKAAHSGLLAARLAARGFTSDTDILGSAQGFAATQSTTADVEAALAERPAPFVADALFKFHAACYLTHDTIEAAAALRDETSIRPDEVEQILIEAHKVHMGVCNIPAPRTGLECKFSLRMTCALALAGEDTFDEGLYSDATAVRPDLVALRERIAVEPTAPAPGTRVTVTLRDGRRLTRTVDVAVPERDLERQQARLERKFRHITRNVLPPEMAEAVIDEVRGLETAHDLRGLMGKISEGLRAA
jgi:2-methylcitrate dehydratase PrpD